MGCYDHHPDASDVHRKLDLVGCRSSGERERAEELDYRVETVVLLRSQDQFFVTSDAEHRRESSAVGSDNIVIKIPCPYSESFSLVHRLPRIRGLEGRKVEKTFVHDGQGICHRLSTLFLDLNLELLLGAQHVRHLNDRDEV